MHDFQSRLDRVFQRVFNNDSLHATPELTARDVQGWDSLAQMELIVAIEKEFKIRFKTSEIVQLKNVGELITVVLKKINPNS